MRFTFPFRRALRWVAGGGALAGVAGIVLSQTLLAPKHELLYRGSVSAAHCIKIDEREACSFVYGFTVGNTGRQAQESVRIEWPLDLQRWHVATQVADIVASAKKTPQPQILPAFEPDKTVYAISRLMPNVLVELRMACAVCTRAQMHEMQRAQPTVEARGEVYEADPRASTLRRGLMNLLRVAGLFG